MLTTIHFWITNKHTQWYYLCIKFTEIVFHIIYILPDDLSCINWKYFHWKCNKKWFNNENNCSFINLIRNFLSALIFYFIVRCEIFIFSRLNQLFQVRVFFFCSCRFNQTNAIVCQYVSSISVNQSIHCVKYIYYNHYNVQI